MIIKLFVMDMDGTLTDGKLYLSTERELIKVFSVKDGLGIKKIQERGVVVAIISGRESLINKHRADELNIKYLYQSIQNKEIILDTIIDELNIKYENVAYIGDDENDLDCILKVGISGAPKDSAENIKNSVDFLSDYNGGDGAVRQFIEYLIISNYV